MATVDLRSQLGQGYTEEDYQKMTKGMRGDAVALPFAHLVIWAFNGDRKAKPAAQQSPTSYFGGWNMDADATDEIADNMLVRPDHTGWIKTERNSRGKDYTVYETRHLHVAPIARRLSWVDKDGRSRTPDYDQVHRRSHLQVLALVGCTMDVGGQKHIECVAPAVLSVKGQGQTESLKEAFAKWSRAIDALRPQMNAKGLPLSSWWLTIGTRGDAEFKLMGKGKDTSEITPLRALLATEKLTAEQMGSRFVGPDNFKLAKQLFEEAQPWVEAWKTPSASLGGRGQQQPQGGHGQGDSYEDRRDDGSEPRDSYAGGYDDNESIPF